ncbi:TPA: hypothetical protein DD449_03995 [Candidatus Berkelbacteria bacterium]|nr:hypothetical protein [Candidatus Berkelbacteria bacterium]
MIQVIAEVRIVDAHGEETYNCTQILDFEKEQINDDDLQISFELEPIKIGKDDAVVITFPNRKKLLLELLDIDIK